MNNPNNVRKDKPQSFLFPFYNVRNISSPEDRDNNRTVYVGHAPLSSVLGLDVNENVREYIVNAGKKRKHSQVHIAIRNTLLNRPEEFSVLNSGMTIVARECQIDEKRKHLNLMQPSIINGAQTQGVIQDFFETKNMHKGQLSLFEDEPEPHIKFEIIVTKEESLIAEVSIARNFQNDVKTISIVGTRGQLDELEKSFQLIHPDLVLRKSETDVSYNDNNVVETEKLLQVIAALVPEELWLKQGEINKVYTYSQRTKCLKEFEEIFNATHPKNQTQNDNYERLYKFYLDVSGTAYDLYEKWKTHDGFKGTRLRKIVRGQRGEIEEVPDGIVFPILASLSVFAKEVDGTWVIDVPSQIDDRLISQAKNAYQNIASSNPNVMGKNKACYSTLFEISTLLAQIYSLEQDINRQ